MEFADAAKDLQKLSFASTLTIITQLNYISQAYRFKIF